MRWSWPCLMASSDRIFTLRPPTALRCARLPSRRNAARPSHAAFVSQPGRTAMRGVPLDQIAGLLTVATNPIKVVNKEPSFTRTL